ncbi:Carboxypeptidase regulatory-like domain-containing protein [Sinosporangium album]|uniref:alpha-amylase n=1 Tax=Sinosporangium album TaxID=504805 RepID=A0A1G7QP90_9ACTN|nr:carboxypeptidase regulatory-like domain-containing protein [Sinosporangium album]SDG00322.1 Carboxypeptidase regulatory-like domain-containing protein [Sinosporangium album]
MSQPRSRWRTALAGTAAALALLLPHGVAHAAPDPAKIDKTLAAALTKAPATFLVRLHGNATLSAAAKATTKAAKGAEVFQAKTTHATASQKALRTLLTAKKAEFTPFWIVNAVKVTGDAGLAAEIAELPEVQRIEPDRAIPQPQQATGKEVPKVNAVEWNIDRIGAPRVWSEFGTRGDGIVVADLSDGVKYDHPALLGKYRGRKADGTVDHNYNWFDPARLCPTEAPCDRRRAEGGTRGLGVAVGGTDTDTIGVAPGAKWIAAHGCCSWASDLLAAAQWMLAPTDLNGRNPRPDLAPDIINNTWEDWGIDPWFAPVIDAWIAAGIFPAFTTSNYLFTCNTVHSPAAGANAYSVGLLDETDRAWSYSGRGSGENGEIKPDITAPGVNVRTSTADGRYAVATGDFAAVSHVSGTVALLWSAVPSLKGDVAATRALLGRTAIDTANSTCGGTPEKNNIYGEGRLDAYAAVRAAPIDRIGGLSGTVTSGGAPVGLATLTLSGPVSRQTATGKDGTYALPRLPVGDYRVTVRKPGYGDATATVTVAANQTAVRDIALTSAPLHAVSGTVTAPGGAPQAGAVVTVPGLAVEATTDAAGRYRLDLPAGAHELKAAPPPALCTGPNTVPVTVHGATVKDITLPRRTDSFGYTCESGTAPFTRGTERLPIDPYGRSTVKVALPFAFPFYEGTYKGVWVSNDGFASFIETDQVHQRFLPSTAAPNAALFPFLGAAQTSSGAEMYTGTFGVAPARTFVVEWRDFYVNSDLAQRVSYAVLLGEDGSVRFQYSGQGVTGQRPAVIGLENERGTDAFVFSHRQASVVDGQVLTFAPSRHGLLTGTVTDAGGRPLAGAAVKAGGAVLTSDADGGFLGYVPAGEQRVTIEKEPYGSVTQTVNVSVGARSRVSASLAADDIGASVAEVELLTTAGASKSRTVKLTNKGTSAATYTAGVDPALDRVSVMPASGQLAPGASATVTVTGDATGLHPGAVRTGRLLVRSGGGTALEIPVTLAVTRHQVAVDAGGGHEVVDSQGERWAADRAYAAGAYGYLGSRSRAVSTTRAIRDTDDQELFRTARESMTEYRFDHVPAGVYTVELGFAETKGARPGTRVFDVLAEGRLAVPLLDLAQEAGADTALTHRYTVKVTDGQLNLRFAAQTGTPLVSSVRVTERPDKTAP